MLKCSRCTHARSRNILRSSEQYAAEWCIGGNLRRHSWVKQCENIRSSEKRHRTRCLALSRWCLVSQLLYHDENLSHAAFNCHKKDTEVRANIPYTIYMTYITLKLKIKNAFFTEVIMSSRSELCQDCESDSRRSQKSSLKAKEWSRG